MRLKPRPYLIIGTCIGVVTGVLLLPAIQGMGRDGGLEGIAWTNIIYVIGGAFFGLAIGLILDSLANRN